jgi:hypothetical protein
MTGEKYIKQAIIASLCEHPNSEKYRARAFEGENLQNVLDVLSGSAHTLRKRDFLAPDDDGHCIVDTPGFWKNLDKVLAILEKNGEKFTIDDFIAPLEPKTERTLLGSAREHDGLKKLFSFDVWKGRYDEMERLWYRVPVPARRETFGEQGFYSIELKRQFMAFEGKSVPEDSLNAAGISVASLFSSVKERGDYEEIKRKLSEKGDFLRKEYVLLLDESGDTLFGNEMAWKRYEDIVNNLHANGQQFEVADFIRQVGTRPTILMRASQSDGDALSQIFTPAHWEGRLSDMMDLWSVMKPAWKAGSLTPEGFDYAYAEAESLTYGRLVDFSALASKADLTRPLNPDAVASNTERPVLPLGLRAFWHNADAITAQLREKGEGLTTADLRVKTGQMGNSCLMNAVKFGTFDKVIDIAVKSGNPITLDDFLSRDRHGVRLLDILADRRELALAFRPEIWVGRVTEMKKLWEHVRASDRPQDDFIQRAEIAVKQATLRQQTGNRFRLGGGPK